MCLIGLIGGISMGKIIVFNYLSKNYEFLIWDVDFYGCEVVKFGLLIFKSIVKYYG